MFRLFRFVFVGFCSGFWRTMGLYLLLEEYKGVGICLVCSWFFVVLCGSE